MHIRTRYIYIPNTTRRRLLTHLTCWCRLLCSLCLCSAVIIFVSGCGFTLRTQNSLPPQMRIIYLQADNPYGQLEISLKKELKAAGITLTENANNALLTLHLSASSFNQTSDTSSGPSTQARIYHLNLTTAFNITDAKGRSVLEQQVVSYAQDLTLNSNEIFDTSTQVDATKQNMQRILIIRILDMLCSKKTSVAITTHYAETYLDGVKSAENTTHVK